MNLIGLALVLFATPSQPQDSLIDLSVKADSMESVLAQLSEQSGFKFEASGDVKNDVISVEWSDVTLDNALEALATASKSKWTQRNGIAYLGRDSVEMRRDERARADRFEEELAKTLKEMEKVGGEGMPKMDGEMGPNMTPEQMQNAARIFRDGMPGNRTAMRLLLSVNRSTLAKMAPGERLVFANRNTPMQKPLAVNLPNLVKTYLDEMADAPQMGQRLSRIRPAGGEQPRSPDEILRQDGASRVFLIVRRTEDGGSLSIEMALTDPQGVTLASGFLSTEQFSGRQQVFMSFGNAPGAGTPALPEPPAPEGKPIELSPELKETLTFFGGRNGGGVMGQVVTQVAFAIAGNDGSDVISFDGGGGEDSEPVTKTWSDLLTTPDVNEPLGWFVAPLMRAATPENDYVIWLSDRLFADTAQRFAGGKLTDKEYDTWFKDQGYESMSVKGTQVQRPVDLAKAAAGRVDRKALAIALQSGLAQNSLRLNQIARYTTTSAEPHFQSGLDIAVASRLDGLLGSQLRTVYGADRTALQIWDQLPADQRPVPATNSAPAPVTVYPTRMGGKINDNLFWNVFNDDPGPTVERQNENGQQRVFSTFSLSIGGGGAAGVPMMFGGTMQDERTEVLPRGIPGETLLNITARGNQVLKAMTGTGGGGQITTAGSLGSSKAAREAMQSATQGRIPFGGPELTQFRVGSQTTYTFQFMLARGVTLTRQLRDADFSGSTVSNFSQLPSEMQAEFTKAYNETKQRMAAMTQRMGNGNQQAP
ncbi:MAG TPA: hypothetical protein PLB31_06395 [Fimbriimonadaceae bacterium]|nr:hypothetical protein [Fimbriimonadaceae bacterium]